jgi:hypothetical protein
VPSAAEDKAVNGSGDNNLLHGCMGNMFAIDVTASPLPEQSEIPPKRRCSLIIPSLPTLKLDLPRRAALVIVAFPCKLPTTDHYLQMSWVTIR